eukprot:m.791739 g.791739  ORF g.791739 m.791739 type:complete len:166 (-) comp23331_c0_seq15:1-498(-)
MRCRIPTLTCDAAVGSHFHYGSTSEYMNEKRAYEELVLMLESDVVTHFLQKKGNILMVVESAEQHFNNDGGFYYPFNGTFPAARRGLSEEVFQAHGGQKGAVLHEQKNEIALCSKIFVATRLRLRHPVCLSAPGIATRKGCEQYFGCVDYERNNVASVSCVSRTA